MRQRFEQLGLELGEAFAGAGGAHGRIAAEMPAAHSADRRGGVGEAHFAQRLNRGRIIAVAGEDEAPGRAGARQGGTSSNRAA